MPKDMDPENPFEGFQSESFIDGKPEKPAKKEKTQAPADDDDDGDYEDDDLGADDELEDDGDDYEDDDEDEGDESLSDDDDGDNDDDGDDASDEEDDGDGDDEDDEEDDDKPRRRNRKSARERIAEKTRLQREAERKAEAYQRELDEWRSGKRKAETRQETPADEGDDDTALEVDLKDLKEPDPKDYDYGEIDPKYMRDLGAYGAKVEARTEAARQRKAQASQEAQTRAQQIQQSWVDNVAEPGKKKYKDFDEKVLNTTDPELTSLSPALVVLVAESPVGADVAYHLAENPEEVRKIKKMSDYQAAAHFGKLEARFTSSDTDAGKSKTRRRSKAPKPLKKKVKGRSTAKRVSPATKNFADFEKLAQSKGF